MKKTRKAFKVWKKSEKIRQNPPLLEKKNEEKENSVQSVGFSRDADPDPHYVWKLGTDHYPDPSFKYRLKNLKKCSNRLIFHTVWLVVCKLMRIRIQIQIITLMRMRIKLITLMRIRIRIQLITLMWIRIRVLPFNLMRIQYGSTTLAVATSIRSRFQLCWGGGGGRGWKAQILVKVISCPYLSLSLTAALCVSIKYTERLSIVLLD